MLSARFHKMEILSAPAREISVKSAEFFLRGPIVFQLSQLLAFLPKNGSLFLSNSILPQNLRQSQRLPTLENSGSGYKKKKEEISSSFHFAHLPSSNSASIFSFFIFLAFAFSFLIWASLAIFFSLAILAFSAFSC